MGSEASERFNVDAEGEKQWANNEASGGEVSRADVSIVDAYGEKQQGYSEASFGEVSQDNVLTLMPI